MSRTDSNQPTYQAQPTGDHIQATPPEPVRKLRRPTGDQVLAGVAAGISEWLGIDVTAVRIGFVVLALLGGAAVPLYAAGWLLIPEEGADLSIGQELAGALRRH